MTDEQLALAFQNGDKSSLEELFTRYKPKVRSIARKFFLTGGEPEDLVQEGMCGLYSAVNGYKFGNTAFSTYAHSCIRNRIIDAVKKSNGAKNSALNNFLPIFEAEDGVRYTDSPEDELIKIEDRKELLEKMKGILSPLEYKIILMYTEGLTMSEISSSVGRSAKSVDNALTRAKHKILKLISAEE